MATIQKVNVYNRTDCCEQFLNNYYILVSNTPFGTGDLNSLLGQAGVESYLQSTVAGTPSMVDINTNGRYVRIQLSGSSFLALAEVEVMGCFGGSGCSAAGTACDDGDATTENDVEDGNCNCAGTPIPCPIAGTICDDGDSSTENDVEDGNCNCAGTPIPCAVAGTTCDDGNANTENDIEDGNCNCAGTPIPGTCVNPTNLALTGTASQSSTQQGAAASRANDGNTNGNFWAGSSVTLTNWENQPWWEVDLGQMATIQKVNVYNRTDCCEQFLDNYYILVSNTPFGTGDLNSLLGQAGVESYLQSTVAGTPSMVDINTNGRYVRIQLSGASFLALAEVEVMGCFGGSGCPAAGTACDDGDTSTENDVEDGNCNCAGTPIPCPIAGTTCDDGDASTENDVEDGNCNCAGTPIPCAVAGTTCDDGNANTENDVEDGNCNCAGTPIAGSCINPTNLALGGTATQSSTQQGAAASRVIDGNTDGNFWGGNSVSLTNWEKYAWLEIDLGQLADIQDINIWNRTDCCEQFLSDYAIYISDVPFTDVIPALTEAQAGVSTYYQAGMAELPSRISIGRTGRYVRVQLMGTSFLAIAELEVMACPVQADLTSSSSDQLIFKAFKDARTTKLQWITNTDYKNDYFVIEHSQDGVQFETLLDAASTSDSEAPSYYQEIDVAPTYGENFYRLKQIFHDGSFVYSNVAQLNFEIDLNGFAIFPNPTTNDLFVNLKEFAGKAGIIEVYNALGQPLYEQEINSIPTYPIHLDTKAYKAGFYSITIKIEGRPRMTKIFVVSKL